MTTEPAVERWSPFRAALYSLTRRDPKSNRVAVELLAPAPGDRLLDLGCGPGAALERAARAGATVAGVDPSPSMVKRAQRRVPGADVKVGSAEAVPFDDDTFDLVMAVATFHHWTDPKAGLGEVRRVMASPGRFLILERKLKGSAGHGLTDRDATGLASDLAAAGFASVTTDTVSLGRIPVVSILATT